LVDKSKKKIMINTSLFSFDYSFIGSNTSIVKSSK